MPRLEHPPSVASALAALVSAEDTIKLEAGETILIQGGAGGVASFSVQLAKHIGARVITTASAANHDYLRHLGADQIIDYKTQNFTKVISGVDAVFDTVGGGEVVDGTFAVCAPAVVPRSSPQDKQRRSQHVTTSFRCGRKWDAVERISSGRQPGGIMRQGERVLIIT